MGLFDNVFKKDNGNDAILGEFSKRFELAKQSKIKLTYDWNEFVDLYNGNHYKNIKLQSHRVQAMENQASAVVNGKMAVLIDNDPEIYVYATNDEDKATADMLNHVISHVWNEIKMPKTLRESVKSMLIYGTSCFKVGWDVEAYNGMGQIFCEEVDIFDIFVDPNATSLKNAEYLIYRTRVPKRKLKKMYPQMQDQIKDNYEVKMDGSTRDDDNQFYKGKGVCDVYEYWHYQDDVLFVTTLCNGVVLEHKESPFHLKKFPFVVMSMNKEPGSFFGISDLKNIRQMQHTLNKAFSIILENFIQTTNTIIVTTKNAGIKPGQLTNKAGQHVIINPGGDIRRLAPEGLPGSVTQMPQIIRDSITEMTGLFDTAKGLANSGVISYSGIAQLTENANSKLKPTLKVIEDAIEEIGEWFIAIMSEYYQERRLVRIAGDGGNYQFHWFDPNDMRETTQEPDPNNPGQMIDVTYITPFDISVKAGSSMIVNRANKYQQVLELYNHGAVDLDTLLSYADVGAIDKIKKGLIAEGKYQDPQSRTTQLQPAIQALMDKIKFSVSSTSPDIVEQALQSYFKVYTDQASLDGTQPPVPQDMQGQVQSPQEDNAEVPQQNSMIPQGASPDVAQLIQQAQNPQQGA